MPLRTGVTVRVVQAGPANGAPVVLVHGWGVHSYLWRRNIPALAAAGRRVLALDLPGHGLSDRPLAPGTYTLEKFTAHVISLFDEFGIARAPIIAQSMGGRIAVEVARTHPSRVAALALFGSVGFGEVTPAASLLRKLPVPSGQLSTLLIRRWMVALGKALAYGRRAKVEQPDVDAYWAVTQFPDYFAAVRQTFIDFDWRPLTLEILGSLSVPALVLFGTRDRTVRPLHAESLVSALPRGRLYWVRDAGHVANEEASEEINPLVVQFLLENG